MAMVSPEGENLRSPPPRIACEEISAPDSTSKSRALSSQEREASCLLSGDNAISPMMFWCPSMTRDCPVATSQMRMVPSLDAENKRCPSEEKSSEETDLE